MPVLDYPIAKNIWVHKISPLNGDPKSSEDKLTNHKVKDAGVWESAVQKIVEFQQLSDDWDGLGAKAPSHELLESAIGLAYTFSEQGVPAPHCVVPSFDGSVVFEWQDVDGTFAAVEIDKPLHAEVMVIEPGQPAKHWTLPTD